MVKCAKCNIDVMDPIQCNMCRKHFDFACSGKTEAGYKKLGERQANWRCLTCKSTQIVKKLPNSPTESPTTDMLMAEIAKLSLQLQPINSVADDIKLIKTDLSALKTSTYEIINKMESFESRLKIVESSQEEVSELKNTISKLEDQLGEKEQLLRYNNAEIKGVPMKQNENLFDILMKIGDHTSCPVNKNNINFVARIQSRGPDKNQFKPIIVSFLSRYMKENFVAAGKAAKTIMPSDIGLSGSGKIYINDHLSIKNKLLLNKTKALASSNNFRFVWVKHSKIFVRKNETSPVVNIKTEIDLEKLKK